MAATLLLGTLASPVATTARAQSDPRMFAETGYRPVRRSAGRAPAPGFRLVQRRNIDGLILYRFRSARLRGVSESRLRRRVITRARPEVLIAAAQRVRAGQSGA